MESIGAEVALVVKAPNQQTDDVRIQVNSSWNIRQLKTHLSEVYPSKPKCEEQKIIYSGQLLADSAVLKDVLRVYGDQQTHTVHLVCTQRSPMQRFQPAAATVGTETDGVRRRNMASEATPASNPPRPETRQNNQNHTAEMHTYYSSILTNLGRTTAAPPSHYNPVMVQQAYIQYVQQYANMWQAAMGNVNQPQQINAVNERPPPQEAVNAREQDGEPAAPRDWLDWLYAISRLAVLMSLLYVYSSPLRLALVVLLAVVGYLYQLGFFDAVPDQRQNEARARPERAADNAETIDNNQPQTETRQQSVLGATWMIFSSFFTSLIPETPNVV